ncbi:MAG: DUF4038 domain-containing protein [Sedimentisphaerales bacterium]|jgi:hypothetical protein
MTDAKKIIGLILMSLTTLPNAISARAIPVDFSHGPLQVSKNDRYLVHKDGTPFFWLADTY